VSEKINKKKCFSQTGEAQEVLFIIAGMSGAESSTVRANDLLQASFIEQAIWITIAKSSCHESFLERMSRWFHRLANKELQALSCCLPRSRVLHQLPCSIQAQSSKEQIMDIQATLWGSRWSDVWGSLLPWR